MVRSSQKHQIQSKAITKLSKDENFNENLFLSSILHPCLQALKSLKPMRPLKPLKPLNPLQFIKDIKATEAFKASKAFKSPKNFTLVKIALPRAWRLKAFSVLFTKVPGKAKELKMKIKVYRNSNNNDPV